MLHRPGSISVSWDFLCNASSWIYEIPANNCFFSLMCEAFGNRTEWGPQSCWDVRIIRGQSSNCCCVGDEVSAQIIVPDIYMRIFTPPCGQLVTIVLCMQVLYCTSMQWWRIYFGFTKFWSNFSPIHKASLNMRMDVSPECGQVHAIYTVTTGMWWI